MIVKYVEGKTILFVPEESLKAPTPPEEPVFFNPRAKKSRDFSVAVYTTVSRLMGREVGVLDLLCGVGARGLRLLREGEGIGFVHFNDFNEKAIELSKLAARENSVLERAQFTNWEANYLLSKLANEYHKIDIIDIDPFGSPAPYFENSVRALRRNGVIGLTATDLQVLFGIHENSALRKYWGRSKRVDFSKEVGIRLLLSALAAPASRYDIGIKPLFSHLTMHYLRVYVEFIRDAGEADRSIGSIGYISHCSSCDERATDTFPQLTCPACGGRTTVLGPLWIGKIFDARFLESLLETLERTENGNKGYVRLVRRAIEESNMPATYFDLHSIADRLQRPVPSVKGVIEKLRDRGFVASRTSIDPVGVRTNAPSAVLYSIVKEA